MPFDFTFLGEPLLSCLQIIAWPNNIPQPPYSHFNFHCLEFKSGVLEQERGNFSSRTIPGAGRGIFLFYGADLPFVRLDRPEIVGHFGYHDIVRACLEKLMRIFRGKYNAPSGQPDMVHVGIDVGG